MHVGHLASAVRDSRKCIRMINVVKVMGPLQSADRYRLLNLNTTAMPVHPTKGNKSLNHTRNNSSVASEQTPCHAHIIPIHSA